MSHEVRRKIVGECDVVEEYVRIEKETKYVMVETTYKTFTQHIVLDCGHVVAKSKYGKVPQSNTRCDECSEVKAPYAVERVKHPPLPLPYKDYVNFKPKEQSK